MTLRTGPPSTSCLKGSSIRADDISDRAILVLLDSPVFLHHGLLLAFVQQASR